jgi:thioredoxin reductase
MPDIGGINGNELLRLMREQAQMYGASIETGRVTRLDLIEGGFQAEWGAGSVTARKVLLATGVTNRKPPMDPELHDEAMSKGLIRYCPVCDGYEVTDKKIGVIGSGTKGVSESVFLRGYTEDITLIAPDRAHDLSAEDRARMQEYGIKCVDGPCEAVATSGDCITIATPYGEHVFDSVYPALGSDTHTELAKQVGARLRRTAPFPSTIISGPACPAFMPRAMSSWASIRSAMPWAKAVSRRRPCAMILPRNGRSSARSCAAIPCVEAPRLLCSALLSGPGSFRRGARSSCR